MAHPTKSNTPPSKTTHPGSSVEDARAVGGKGDFGVPESNVVGRTYTSTNTKRADRGNAPPRGGADESRTTGVGGNASGDGSSSGGDLDTDIVGVGTDGTGIAASGRIDEPTEKDAAQPLPSHQIDARQRGVFHPGSADAPKGSTVERAGDDADGETGADAAANTHRDDDSFAGEVSNDEASGRNDAD